MGCRENFGKNLQYLVVSRGYDRKHFSKKINVSYTTLSEWWMGRHLPNDEYIDRIADELHVSVGILFEDNEKIETVFKETSAFASLIVDKKPYMLPLLQAADRLSMDKVLFITQLLNGYRE